jgi:hypothetical protein
MPPGCVSAPENPTAVVRRRPPTRVGAGHRARRLCVGAILWGLFSAHVPASDADRRAAGAALQAFLAIQARAQQYSASRRLEASGGGRRGWLDVQTDFTLDAGLVYEVTAEGGSGYIRTRVLRSLLDEEQRLAAEEGGAGAAISAANYALTPLGLDADGRAVVALRPLRRDRSLIAGRMTLTAGGDLLRVEGRLARNPSFWVTRVTVVRSYRRINDVTMPVSLDTTADLRLLGSSALRMTYRYSRIDDRAVDDHVAQ